MKPSLRGLLFLIGCIGLSSATLAQTATLPATGTTFRGTFSSRVDIASSESNKVVVTNTRTDGYRVRIVDVFITNPGLSRCDVFFRNNIGDLVTGEIIIAPQSTFAYTYGAGFFIAPGRDLVLTRSDAFGPTCNSPLAVTIRGYLFSEP
jgi:hypothetical protein